MTKIHAIADNVLLRLSARIFQVIGIPTGLAIMGWIVLSIIALDKRLAESIERTNGLIMTHEFRLNATDVRLYGIEQRERDR